MSSTAAKTDPLPEPVNVFMTYMDAEKRSSAATLRSYEKDLAQFEEFLQERRKTLGRPEDIKPDLIRAWLSRLHGQRLAKSTLSRKLSSLRSFFKYMTRHRFIPADPMVGIRNPKQEIRQPRALNVDQAVSIMDSQVGDGPEEKRDLALVELLYGSGLRVSEAIALNMFDADTSSGVVRVFGKGSKERLSPLSDTARKAIDSYLAVRSELGPSLGEQALFLGNRGGRINRRQVNRILARMAEQAGVFGGVHPHMLRHSFASHMLQSGADMRAVQELLGHEHLSTTQRYTHLNLQQIMNVYDRAHPLSGNQSPDSPKEDDEDSFLKL
ncbi:tyrosine recombinase XerC [Maridesulfovibrio sp.]|uniref:tyrosine recombinase XerC n=1 Tax=Maridesulfovibrio sp. TaxID=2795000 RepID=UPI002A18B274|nr:tyrosine recombinase XerC [Maridesulfovibrio sp.]